MTTLFGVATDLKTTETEEDGGVLADLPVQEFFNGPRLGETSREADLFVKGELV